MIYLYFHAGSANHGCEAIVRSTCSLLGTRPVLISDAPDQDRYYGLEQLADIRGRSRKSYTAVEKMRIRLSCGLFGNERTAYYYRARKEAEAFESGCVALSIGGDNYCYGEAYNAYLAGLNRALHEKGLKTVLWGCSVEPEQTDRKTIKDLASYDLITARESITARFLREAGCRVVETCDPAFMLEKKETALPAGFIPGRTIGINGSPLIIKKENKKDIVLRNYELLMQHIIDNTDDQIALIPHVVMPGNDDREFLKTLYDRFARTGRVCMVEDRSCQELKYLIAGCSMFLGARTHAVIAAYSSMVPALAIGYSTKAIGIARDLFGTEQGYVLPVGEMSREDDLTRAFCGLHARQAEIRQELTEKLPLYCRKINRGREAIGKL